MLVLSLLVSMLPVFAPTASAEYRTVTFNVVGADNDPITNAVILMERSGSPPEVVRYNSYYGRYEEAFVDYGEYSVTAYAPGYNPVEYGTVIVGNSYTEPSINFTTVDTSDPVDIPDDSLRGYLKEILFGSSESAETITENAMASITHIDNYYSEGGLFLASFGGQISDLAGLEYAVNLMEIDLRWHNVSSLAPLANLPRLHTVTMSANPLSAVPELAEMPSLRTIEIQDADIAELPATLPSGVESIYLDGNRLTDISALASLMNLQYISLNHNQITDMGPIAELPNASRIELGGNTIAAVPSLNLPNLGVLYLNDNDISDISGFENAYVPNLSLLDLQYNRIGAAGLESLTYLPNLYSIDLRGNGIASLAGLTANSQASLHWGRLDISENEIIDLSPVERLTNLYSFFASHNNIVDMSPVTSLSYLNELDLSHNQIAAIPAFSAASEIETLRLSHNNIADFSSLNDLTHIDFLYLDHNQIASLSFLDDIATPNFSFRMLELGGNAFTDLAPLSRLTNIVWLFLNDSAFTDLTPLVTLQQNGGFSGYSPSVDLYNAAVDLESETQQAAVDALRSAGVQVNSLPPSGLRYWVTGNPMINPTAESPARFRIEASLEDEINYYDAHEIRVRVTKDGAPVGDEEIAAVLTGTQEALDFKDGEIRLDGGTGEELLFNGVTHDVELTFSAPGVYEFMYEMWVESTDSVYSNYWYRVFSGSRTVVVGSAEAGSLLSEAAPGSIVEFAGQEWVLIDPVRRQLLLRSTYGAPRPWEPGFYGSQIVSDPAFHYDPVRPGSIADELNRAFLDSLDVGGSEDQWIVPTSVQVPYLQRYEDGTIEEKESPPPYSVADTTKVHLLTYDEYRWALASGALAHGDDRLLDWDVEWYLSNPITEEYYTHQYHAFVNTDGSINFYPMDIGVRPVVLLQENVQISGGNGSDLPYTLTLPAPEVVVQQSELEVGALTDVSVDIVANRDMKLGEAVKIAFPDGYDVAYLPEYSGVEVRVGSTVAAVEGLTSVGNDVYVPLPIAAGSGETLTVYFPGDAGIHNAVTAGTHEYRIEVPGAEASPATVNLTATLHADVMPGTTSDSANRVEYSITYYMPAFQPLPDGSDVTVTFPAGYSVPNEIDSANVKFYYYDADALVTAPASAVSVSGNEIVVSPPGELPDTFTLVFEPDAGLGNPAAAGEYVIWTTVSTATEPAGLPVTIVEAADPDLAIQMTREDDYFLPGLVNRKYTVAVTNVGDGPTNGPVTVEANFPIGLTVGSITGTGWTCSLFTGACTRSDVLEPGESYPQITAMVSVDIDIAGSLNAVASVTGGGDANSYNNSTDDVVTVVPWPEIQLSVEGSESWATTAAVDIDVIRPIHGLPLDSSLFAYTWTETPEPPGEAEWLPFENGDTIVLEGQNGEWYLHVRAGDADGNLVYVSSDRFRLDNIAPTFSPWFYKLSDGSAYAPDTWTNGSVGIDGAPYDSQSGLAAVEYSSDGGESYASFGSAIEINAEGVHAYRFRAKDAAGNETLSELREIKIDKTAPTLNVMLKRADGTPYAPGTATNQPVVIDALDVSDALSGTSSGSVDFSVDGSLWLPADEFELAENGTYEVRFRAIDAAGNVQVTTPITVIIFNASLEVDLTTGANAPTNGEVEVSAGVVGGLEPYTFKWAEGNQDTAYFKGAGTEFSGSFAAGENGDYSVYTVDAAGNESVTVIRIENIVRALPEIELTASPNTPTNGNVDVTVSATAEGVGIGNAVSLVKWLAGEATVEDFASGGTDITGDMGFEATENGWYTVYALDLAGNAAVKTLEVSNISRVAPSIETELQPAAPTNGAVGVVVEVSGGVGPYVQKWAPGVQSAAFFAVGGTSFTGSFQASANGLYTVYVRDSAGNAAVQSVVVGNIVKTAPTIGLTASPGTPTNGNVKVTVAASVGGTSIGNAVSRVKWLAGEATLADFVAGGTDIIGDMSFEATENGWYTVYVKDFAGNAAVKTIQVSNISREAPNISAELLPAEPTNGAVSVGATVTGGVGPYALKWAAGNQELIYFAEGGTSFAESFEVSENGDYTVYARDAAGNASIKVVSVGNIVRVAPEIELTASPDTPTNGNVDVTVSATVGGTSIGNAVSLVKWLAGEAAVEDFAAGGADITGDMSFEATENGWYTVYVKDLAGNAAVQKLQVSNISREAPSIETELQSAAPTNGKVSVGATVTGGVWPYTLKWASGIQEIMYFAEGGTSFAESFEVDENGDYTVYARDQAGNAAVKSLQVSSIVRAMPEIELTASPSAPTNGNVDVMVSATVGGTSIGNAVSLVKWLAGEAAVEDFAFGGTDITGDMSFEATENGWYTVYVRDLAGNAAVQKLQVSNIVRALPEIELTATPDTPTNGNVDVTVSATAGGTSIGNAVSLVKWLAGEATLEDFASGGLDITGDMGFEASENGWYTVYVRDLAGNAAVKKLRVSNISREAPSIETELQPAAPTNGAVSVGATAAGGIGPYALKWAAGVQELAYFAEGGTTFVESFEVSENGDYTVYARDAAGNSSIKAVSVGNIVRALPEIELTASPDTPTNGNVDVMVSATVGGTGIGNAVSLVKWLAGEATLEDFAAGGTDITGDMSFEADENGWYTVYVRDLAGNEAVKTLQVSNITRTMPSIETELHPAAPTNGAVNVSVSVSGGAAPYAMKWAPGVQNAEFFTGGGTGFANAFQANANGLYTVFVRDSAGNTAVQTVVVDKIVKTVPVIGLTASPETPTNGNVEVAVAAIVGGTNVGNAVQAAKWLAGEAAIEDFASGGTDITGDMSFEVTENGWYTVYVRDVAGNEALKTLQVSNIARTAPSIEIELQPSAPTNGTVNVNATVSGGAGPFTLKWAAGEQELSYFAGGGTPFAESFEAGDNGVYTVYARDEAGNASIEVVHVNLIVRTAPEIALTASPETPTNGSVTVTVAASVYGAEIGNLLKTVKWLEGEATVEDFASGGFDITTGQTFEVSENGWYTVYAADWAGNAAVEHLLIENMNQETPSLDIQLEPGTPTNQPVEVTVTATVYGAANALVSLYWGSGGESVPLAFEEVSGEDGATKRYVAQIEATANGNYLVRALDAAGNEKTQTVDIGNIVTIPPSVLLSASTQPASGARIFVSLQAAGTMNEVAATKWAPGQWTPADYDEVTGTPGVPPNYHFTVYENGWYTVFAKDLAGNVQAASIWIDTIVPVPPAEKPTLLFAAVGNNGDRVRLMFDRALDTHQTLSAASFQLHGVNAIVSGVYYDEADPKAIWLELDANEEIVWQSGAAISAAADAVRTPSGGINGAVSGLRVVTPAVVAEVIGSIDTNGEGIEVKKLITYMRSGTVDLNQDGVTDKGDIAFVLELIPSVTFQRQ